MSESNCSVPVCDRPAKTKGYCPGHYMRSRKGLPLNTPLRSRGPGFDLCQVDGCGKPHEARGMCSMHYNRERCHGSANYEPALRLVTELPPLMCLAPGCSSETRARALCATHAEEWDASHPYERTDSLEVRLNARTMKTGDCWYWVGNLSHDYYGYFGSKHLGTSRAHRTSWVMANGPIPDGMQLDHLCHVTYCVRPSHLRVVTPRQNSDNRRGANRGNKSGYRGVTWSAQMKMWQGRYMVKYVPYEVGYFEDPYECSEAVEKARHETKVRLGIIRPESEAA